MCFRVVSHLGRRGARSFRTWAAVDGLARFVAHRQVEFDVGLQQRLRQQRTVKQQGVLAGGEAHRAAEEAGKGLGVVRRGMPKVYFGQRHLSAGDPATEPVPAGDQ